VIDIRDLTGSGVATLWMREQPDQYYPLQFQQVTYRFTPEPSTFGIVLASLGLLAAVSLRRRA